MCKNAYLCKKIECKMKIARFVILLTIIFCHLSIQKVYASTTTSMQLRQMADKKYYGENFPEALAIYIKAMEAATAEGNDSNYIACTGYIGNIYNTFGDNKSCMTYYLKGYRAAKRIGSLHLQTSFLNNIIICYTQMGNVKEAKHYYALLMTLPININKPVDQYYRLYSKAHIYAAEGKYDKAISEHRNALQFATQKHMKPKYRLFQLSEIGNIYVRANMPNEAIAMGYTCLSLARSIDNSELIVNAYGMLADAYSQLQLRDSARHYREMYFNLKDSVYNTKNFYNARYKLSEYENREHESLVSQLNNQISFQTYVLVTIVFFTLLLSVSSYIIYKKNRHLVQTQRLLIRKNEDLEERERQNHILLQQYLQQVELNEQSSVAEIMDEKLKDSSDNDLSHDNIPTDENVVNHDNLEKQLLNKINDVMEDMSVISNPDFCLQMLADMVQSNTNYVSRVINNSYNKNFKTLLNERRIREACHKLSDTENYVGYTMQVIYEEVGYKNASSFIRAFKKVYNMTPSEYQKLASK